MVGILNEIRKDVTPVSQTGTCIVRKGEAEGINGYIIACFSDPGLLAAQKLGTAPVIGIDSDARS